MYVVVAHHVVWFSVAGLRLLCRAADSLVEETERSISDKLCMLWVRVYKTLHMYRQVHCALVHEHTPGNSKSSLGNSN